MEENAIKIIDVIDRINIPVDNIKELKCDDAVIFNK